MCVCVLFGVLCAWKNGSLYKFKFIKARAARLLCAWIKGLKGKK